MARIYHCLFEQSGTFKNVIKKLGGVAKDYDILNNYGETDCVCDLFDEIDKAFLELPSIFDDITSEDFIIAFFPCTRFENQANMMMLGNQYQMKKWSDEKKLNYDLYLHKQLHCNYETITKMALVTMRRSIPMVIENPSGGDHYLTRNWAIRPKVIDNDRTKDGDFFKKPTQYWFLNCEPKRNLVFEAIDYTPTSNIGEWRGNIEMRSMISPQYAERFIKKYIAEQDGNIFKV